MGWRARFHTMLDDFNAVVEVPTFATESPLGGCFASPD